MILCPCSQEQRVQYNEGSENRGLVVIKRSFVGILLGITMASLVFAGDEDTVKRIKKIGAICVEGAECASQIGSVQVLASVGSNVESNFNKSCATCHKTGAAGAPMFADPAAWAPRLEKGIEVLYANTINGLPPAMPQRGMCFGCSDQDLRDLVDYMVDAARQ